MNPDSIWVRLLWPLLASLAGAITALSFRPYRNMTIIEVAMSIVVGTSFATFVGPLAAVWIFGNGPVDIRLLGATFYLMASGSNILIPMAIKKLGTLIGSEVGK
jgi:hypothetical protein